MTKTTLVLTEALSKLKMYDKKIDKELRNLEYGKNLIDYTIGNETKGQITREEPAELKVNAQATLDKVRNLIKNRVSLKAAIAQANATTTLDINGKEYTIVQAIERKNGLNREIALLDTLESQLADVKNKISHINTRAKEKANQIVETQVGSDAKNKKTEEIESLYNLIYDKNKAEIVDPIGLETVIEKMREDIETFEQTVDVQLSIANAKTFIEVDFDEE